MSNNQKENIMNMREMKLFIEAYMKTATLEQLLAIRDRMLDYLENKASDAEDRGAAIKALRMVEEELDARRKVRRKGYEY